MTRNITAAGSLSSDSSADDHYARIHALVVASEKTLVVLDDDPTGTQTVHDVAVLTNWSVPTLAAELARRERCFYILTNTRALPRAAAVAVNRDIARNLLEAMAMTQRDIAVVSRSDSTLRGHFPWETDALAEAFRARFDGLVIVPTFPEGGRVTIDGTHYVSRDGQRTPVAETEFARDATFGFRHSDLRQWVEEKTEGRIAATDVAHIPIGLLRGRDAAREVCRRLCLLPRGKVIVVDAETYDDLAAFTHALLLAESSGRCYLARTAASFIRVRAAIDQRPHLGLAELAPPNTTLAGGLIVVGSYVDTTTQQLERVLDLPSLGRTEIDVDKLLEPTTRDAEIARVAQVANEIIAHGQHAVIYTSRKVVNARGRAGELPISASVSAALVEIVQRTQTRPRFIIAKGGITSSDLATGALGVRRAVVRGQAAAGIPVWSLGGESRFPGLPYIIFPGNVGDANTLRDLLVQLG